ncbi:MAG: flagellar export chaperone FliS [Pseudomonadota bacterium]
MSNAEALAAYRSVNTAFNVDDADPHRLIQMLLDGALERIHTAMGCISRGDVAGKGEQIGKAISIVEGLRISLNPEGGEISRNLGDLYDYIARRLLEANLADDPSRLNESASLLREIKTAWDVIGATAEES